MDATVSDSNENRSDSMISYDIVNNNSTKTDTKSTSHTEPIESKTDESCDGEDQKSKKKLKTMYATGRWTTEEHKLFLEGLDRYGKEWKRVAMNIGTRSVMQTRTHAQKHFMKETDSSFCQSRQQQEQPGSSYQSSTDRQQSIIADKSNLTSPYEPLAGIHQFPPAPSSHMNSSYPDYHYRNDFIPQYHHFGNMTTGNFNNQFHHPSLSTDVDSAHRQHLYRVEGARSVTSSGSLTYPNYSNHQQPFQQPNVTDSSIPSHNHFPGYSTGSSADVAINYNNNSSLSSTENPLPEDIVFPVTSETIMKYSGNRDYVDLLKSNCWIYHALPQPDQIHFVKNIIAYLVTILKRRFFHMQQRHHQMQANDNRLTPTSGNAVYLFHPVQDPTGYVEYEICLDTLKNAAWQFHPFWLLGEHHSPSNKSTAETNFSTSSSFVYCDYGRSYPSFVTLSKSETRNLLRHEGPKNLLIVPNTLLESLQTKASSNHYLHTSYSPQINENVSFHYSRSPNNNSAYHFSTDYDRIQW